MVRGRGGIEGGQAEGSAGLARGFDLSAAIKTHSTHNAAPCSWLCLTVLAMCGHVRPCSAMFGHVRPCLACSAVFGRVWSFLASFGLRLAYVWRMYGLCVTYVCDAGGVYSVSHLGQTCPYLHRLCLLRISSRPNLSILAQVMSTPYLISAIVSPFLGLGIDRFGGDEHALKV